MQTGKIVQKSAHNFVHFANRICIAFVVRYRCNEGAETISPLYRKVKDYERR